MGSEREIEAKVEQLLIRSRDDLRPEVNDVRFELAPDAGGDPSIFVWIEMPDSAEDAWSRPSREAMRDLLIDRLRTEIAGYWPYLSFTTTNESPASTRSILCAA